MQLNGVGVIRSKLNLRSREEVAEDIWLLAVFTCVQFTSQPRPKEFYSQKSLLALYSDIWEVSRELHSIHDVEESSLS